MFPPMIWAALRLGQRGQTLVMFVAASCAIWGTYHGFGPFSQPSVHERLMLLQSFLAVLAVTGLVLAASASEGRRAERHRATSHAITQILGESKDLREVSRRVLPAIGETLEWDLGALWSLDREARVLRCVEAWHRPALSIGEFADVTRERTFPPGLGLPGRVWSSGRPHWIKDVVVDPNFPRASSADRAGLHAAFGFPIQLGGATLGVLEFFSRHVRDPDPELLDLVAGFGGQIGLFIERIRSEQLRSASRKRAVGGDPPSTA
ncbi:MAG: GAF domain-containing protein [Planctomycetota bacterium]